MNPSLFIINNHFHQSTITTEPKVNINRQSYFEVIFCAKKLFDWKTSNSAGFFPRKRTKITRNDSAVTITQIPRFG